MNPPTFRPYDNWWSDVETAGRILATPTMTPVAQEIGRRLLAACEPPKCGKVLHHDRPREFVSRNADDNQKVTCRLPAGHHPVGWVYRNPDESIRCGDCEKPVNDPIHSPGHVADVPEGAWR